MLVEIAPLLISTELPIGDAYASGSGCGDLLDPCE